MSDSQPAADLKRQRNEVGMDSPDAELDKALLAVLDTNGDYLITSLGALIITHGLAEIKAWRQQGKHAHTIVHELVRRKKGEALRHLVKVTLLPY
jgi:hypothetical protein